MGPLALFCCFTSDLIVLSDHATSQTYFPCSVFFFLLFFNTHSFVVLLVYLGFYILSYARYCVDSKSAWYLHHDCFSLQSDDTHLRRRMRLIRPNSEP